MLIIGTAIIIRAFSESLGSTRKRENAANSNCSTAMERRRSSTAT